MQQEPRGMLGTLGSVLSWCVHVCLVACLCVCVCVCVFVCVCAYVCDLFVYVHVRNCVAGIYFLHEGTDTGGSIPLIDPSCAFQPGSRTYHEAFLPGAKFLKRTSSGLTPVALHVAMAGTVNHLHVYVLTASTLECWLVRRRGPINEGGGGVGLLCAGAMCLLPCAQS